MIYKLTSKFSGTIFSMMKVMAPAIFIAICEIKEILEEKIEIGRSVNKIGAACATPIRNIK